MTMKQMKKCKIVSLHSRGSKSVVKSDLEIQIVTNTVIEECEILNESTGVGIDN